MFPSYLEVQNTMFLLVPSPAIWRPKNEFTEQKKIMTLYKVRKTVAAILERENKHCGSLLFGDKKMQFTTVRRKEKDYDIYLKSEKLVQSNQEREKNVSQLFGSAKTGSQLFRA